MFFQDDEDVLSVYRNLKIFCETAPSILSFYGFDIAIIRELTCIRVSRRHKWHAHLGLRWNSSCEATPLVSEMWPFKRGGLSSGWLLKWGSIALNTRLLYDSLARVKNTSFHISAQPHQKEVFFWIKKCLPSKLCLCVWKEDQFTCKKCQFS